MVCRNKINASGMDIELLSQEFEAHRRAFNMPAGETLAPRRLKADFFIKLPESKIFRIFFLLVFGDSGMVFISFSFSSPKHSIVRHLGRVEINPVIRFVCVFIFFELSYQLGIFFYMIACEINMTGYFYIEFV